MKKSSKLIAIIVFVVALVGTAIGLFACSGKGKDKPITNSTTPSASATQGASSEVKPTEGSAPESTPTKEPVPGESGGDGDASANDCIAPVFSLTDYYYSADQVLKITSPIDKEGEIYYTLDGSEPTKSSLKYSDAGITLKEGEKVLAKRQEPGYRYEHEGSSDVNGYIVKARIFFSDGRQSATTVHSYLVNKNITKRYQNYVLCLSGEPNDLTKTSNGILGSGSKQRGEESERNAYAELLTSDGQMILSQYIAVRPYGGASRGNLVKSFKMYAKKSAGSDIGKFKLPEDIFGTANSEGKVIKSYDRLVVRNGGNDMNFGFLRDELNQRLMRMAGYPVTEGAVPLVVYVNGNYYGFFWLHENYCDDYFKDLFPNKEATGKFKVLEGGDAKKNIGDDPSESDQLAYDDYDAFYQKYAYSDLTDDGLYNELKEHIDVENYLDYFAFNIYLANNDWPNNNYKCYRYFPGEGEALGEGVYDGRWRYLPHDMDFGQYLYYNNDRPHETDKTTGASNNSFARVCDPNNEKYAPLFAALMKRSDCMEHVIGKMIELGTTVLSEESVSSLVKEISKSQSKELPVYIPLLAKLGRNEWWPAVDNLKNNYDQIKRFHRERLEYLLGYFESDYGYTREQLMAMKP